MKLDLQSLSAEPLIYMLMHSGAFVTVLGIVFFFIGLIFGRATWGRYKRQARELRREVADMKGEIADLKRKLAEASVKPGPEVPIVTEIIPMPRREPAVAEPPPTPGLLTRTFGKTKPAQAPSLQPPAAAHVPPTAEAPLQEPDPAPSAPPAYVSPDSAAAFMPASVAEDAPAPVEDMADSALSADTAPPVEPAAPDQPAEGDAEPVAPPPPPPASPAAEAEVVPAPAERPGSALSSIITHAHVPHEHLKAPALSEIPTLPEIPLPAGAVAPQPEAKPEAHPHLGLIYRGRPAHLDDLTALKGVGRQLEQRLHVLGIYTYEQIAGWTKDQVREFSARLAFKDRIEREHWVEQARVLVAKRNKAAAAAAAAARAESIISS